MRFRGGAAAVVAAVLVAGLAGCGESGGGGRGDAGAGDAKSSAEPSEPSEPSAKSSSEPSAAASSGSAFTPLPSAELQGRWWSWAAREPAATNPVMDKDGSDCERNQKWDVWFLAGSFGTKERRTCTVPDNVQLAFPLANLMTPDEQDCAVFMEQAKGSAHLDGKALEAQTHPVEGIMVEGVAGNPVTDTDQTLITKGCGLWVQLPPLKAGSHSLKIRGEADDLSVAVDYTLKVEAAQG
ncbi:signal protein [Streptomyces sp. N35]|uniref:signal protein n=1 Tax=Streptomyces sp. N35 TaxID=2795730 RepID=UPI001F2CABC9|nr:signal protein [Streptomyces sp. N35]